MQWETLWQMQTGKPPTDELSDAEADKAEAATDSAGRELV